MAASHALYIASRSQSLFLREAMNVVFVFKNEQLMQLGSISHSFSRNLTHFHSTSHSFTMEVVGISVVGTYAL